MDWFYWVSGVITLVAIAILIILRYKGYINTDGVVVSIGVVVEFVRKAEKLWEGYVQAGVNKKAYVLEMLKQHYDKFDQNAAGKLIDAVVGWLNATDWA